MDYFLNIQRLELAGYPSSIWELYHLECVSFQVTEAEETWRILQDVFTGWD